MPWSSPVRKLLHIFLVLLWIAFCFDLPVVAVLILFHILSLIYFHRYPNSKIASYTLFFVGISCGFGLLATTGGTRSPFCLSLISIPLRSYSLNVQTKATVFAPLFIYATFVVMEFGLNFVFNPPDHEYIYLWAFMLNFILNYLEVGVLYNESQTAKSANYQKSQFLAHMSHEIRTPLTTIIGWTDFMLSSEVPKSEQNQLLKTIHNSGHQLLSLVNDILDFSRIEGGKLELEYVPFNLKEFLDNVCTSFDVLMKKKNLYFVKLIHLPSINYVIGDSLRIGQCLNNLLSNAHKFTENGSVIFSCVEKSIKDEVVIEFSVQDTGIGMTAEAIEKLLKFKAFTQADHSVTRKYGGSGLGMVITQKLLRMMGSPGLRIESVPNYGTTFSFILKLKATQQCEPHQHSEKYTSKQHMNILLVEDNILNQKMIRRLVEILGHSCQVANDGIEAIRYAQSQYYDVILMDMHLPHLSGVEATKQIRSVSGPNIKTKIIALTANADNQSRTEALSNGFDYFLPKPITVAKLREAFNNVNC